MKSNIYDHQVDVVPGQLKKLHSNVTIYNDALEPLGYALKNDVILVISSCGKSFSRKMSTHWYPAVYVPVLYRDMVCYIVSEALT